MRNFIVLLVFFNVILLLGNLFVNAQNKIPEMEQGVPLLVVLPETPGGGYSANKATGVSSCYTVGPYSSEKAAQLVAGNIRTYGMDVIIRSLSSKKIKNYLVYIADISSLEQAKKISVDLVKQNVNGYSIIEEGPYKNTITFGFFENLDKAKRKAEYIRYLGYDAKFSGQKVQRQVFWVDYDEPVGAATPALQWSRSLNKNSAVQVIPRNCDQQAWYGEGGAFASY
ncbi:MAG: SPOR domain-containing protein [Thiotrichaceae bacterium]|nr:SPOR domain-containing protein [Thiotrichaceae bacterium]